MASKLALPKESTATFLKKTFGITYPWLYKDTLPSQRLTEQELSFRGVPHFSKLPIIAKALLYFSKFFILSTGRKGAHFMTRNFGSSYYPDEFLKGAYLIAKPAIESLSYNPLHPSSFQKYSSFYTEKFFDRFQKEFDQLRKLKDVGIEIAVSEVHDAQIKREWLMEGPEFVTKEMLSDPNIKIFDLIEGGRTILKLSNESQGLFNPLSYTRLPGVKVHIDVDLLVDTAFTVYQINDPNAAKRQNNTKDNNKQIMESTPIYHEFTEKRNIILRLSSPWFKSKCDMVELSTDSEGNLVPIWDWSWKISDIDYLLLSESKGHD